jgi:four helix bundle protein
MRDDDRIRSFRDLEAWQLGMELVDLVLPAIKPLQDWDLRRQMAKAVVSIPTNVAEGWKRKRRRQAYQNHVSIAMGSEGELETEMEICFRNGYLKRENCDRMWTICVRAGQVLERLHDSLD